MFRRKTCTLQVLYQACETGDLTKLKKLVKAGIDVNGVSESEENESLNKGETPLFVACKENQREIAEALIGYGADVNRADNQGRSPLYIACARGGDTWFTTSGQYDEWDELIYMLIKLGADVNQRADDGTSPLYKCSEFGYINAAKALLDNGALVDQPTKDGSTSLYNACTEGVDCPPFVELLIKYKADVNLTMKDGSSLLDAACQKRSYDIIEMLEANGAAGNQSEDDCE